MDIQFIRRSNSLTDVNRSYRMEDGRLTPMRSLRSSRFLRSPRPPRSPALAGAEGRPS